ncbi:methionine ABC transporter permease [Marinilactibacillus psychrotolerans]|uniref:D-methionine transport system permease protein n=1 Tax=Marinilactibacillus piezotolerans TaxID=258723 RepID=A0A1I3X592_9LACT|nr:MULTISPECIES: methionine ABC transporter permease [Marinilactibacillus]API88784.1 methionine ABC transporter permease [Marinilactibacillus sp. 15R]SFK14026.1 D-methionine transport system permease protein [Marinilactibacillus piezotolerans]
MNGLTDFIESIAPNVWEIRERVLESTWETIYMILVSALIAGIIGIIIGVILVITNKNGIKENVVFYTHSERLINTFRSVPFIILLALIAPFTRLVVGTTIGTTAAIVPIIVGIIPFYSRQVENALLEVDPGIVEAAQAMGSSPLEIIFGVYLKEGLPSLVRVSAVSIINLIGLTTMAGVVGGGGLGDLAIARGYNRFQMDVTIVSTLLIMVIVFITQWIGRILIKRTSH